MMLLRERCDDSSVNRILELYGSHHQGDRYNVKLDGVPLKLDFMGEESRVMDSLSSR